MSKSIILHIPHSSTHIPCLNDFVVTADIIQTEISRFTDWYTDELFPSNEYLSIVTPFSRVFCDVERFPNDEMEPMSVFGMGFYYTHTDDGILMRKSDAKLKQKIMDGYYNPHHERFSSIVSQQLDSGDSCLIIDCHSFPNIPFNASFDKSTERPDFNIGSDPFHTPPRLIEQSIQFFEKRGYSVLLDRPYSGSIVPMKFFEKCNRVNSIMLEVNRDLYLEKDNIKSSNFSVIQGHIKDWIKMLQRLYIVK